VAINHQTSRGTFVADVTMMAKIRRIGKYPERNLALRLKN
jgi:hypothetical protein